MPERADAFARILFDKPTLQDCSVEQVDALAQQYPYFGAAQWLLLKKSEPAAASYDRSRQHAALHFFNPLQLEFFMHPDFFETEVFQKPMPAEIPVATKEPYEKLVQPVEERTEMQDTSVGVGGAPASKNETLTTEEKPIPAEPLPFTFEPYHTVDYFASQGIKLSQQDVANDALGKGLKSFTEWLKTMKRLPESAASQSNDAAVEQKVENLAAHSLDSADVVTESMAEVWLKQGNIAKAKEVYDKLRLRNPAKSAYFAAKIESLKK